MVPYRTVFEELDKRQIRYLVAGGFAVNFHQVQRATVDLDLIIEIEKDNILKFVALMKELGFVPRLPVEAADFADDTIRRRWISEKGMMVFTFIHQKNPFEVIDVFSEEPFPFDKLWERRLRVSAFGLELPVVGKADLIAMKKKANREKDRFDIEQLKKNTD
ncbi:MAG: hypothetical protein HY537_07270 [Deltaproteobacteria bacterium]|nr:hypothetical protein [Deltaproteobacteria bacterium]